MLALRGRLVAAALAACAALPTFAQTGAPGTPAQFDGRLLPAIGALERGDFTQAVESLKPVAASGSNEARYLLGIAYELAPESAGGCLVSTGLFAGFFGRLADAPISVLEVDAAHQGPGRARFLLGSIDVMGYVWEAMERGIPYDRAAASA